MQHPEAQPASPVTSLRHIRIKDTPGGQREMQITGVAGDVKFLRLDDSDFDAVADAMMAARHTRAIDWDLTDRNGK